MSRYPVVPEPDTQTAINNANMAKTLAIIAIVLILPVAGGLGWMFHQEHQLRMSAQKEMATQLAAQQSTLTAAMNQQLAIERDRVDSLYTEIGRYKQQLAAVTARTSSLAAEQPQLAASIYDLQGQCANLQTDFATEVPRLIASRIDPLELRVDTLDTLRTEACLLAARTDQLEQQSRLLAQRETPGWIKAGVWIAIVTSVAGLWSPVK